MPLDHLVEGGAEAHQPAAHAERIQLEGKDAIPVVGTHAPAPVMRGRAGEGQCNATGRGKDTIMLGLAPP